MPKKHLTKSSIHLSLIKLPQNEKENLKTKLQPTYFLGEKFPPHNKNNNECSFSQLLIQVGVLTSIIRQEKNNNKSHIYWERKKQILFINNMIIYMTILRNYF